MVVRVVKIYRKSTTIFDIATNNCGHKLLRNSLDIEQSYFTLLQLNHSLGNELNVVVSEFVVFHVVLTAKHFGTKKQSKHSRFTFASLPPSTRNGANAGVETFFEQIHVRRIICSGDGFKVNAAP
jgi:hypothetical protein